MVDYFEWPQDQEITYIPLGEELDPTAVQALLENATPTPPPAAAAQYDDDEDIMAPLFD